MAIDGPPADLDQVRQAFRLGWAVAELRGRHRPDRYEQPLPFAPEAFGRTEHELPLGIERGADELRIEVLKTAQGLSSAIGLDQKRPVAKALGRVVSLAWTRSREDADIAGSWDALADAFFTWDARIQDALVVQANLAAAYQLGRGLAETYWELHLARPADQMGSWECVLGPDRDQTLQRLALRLSPYVGSAVLAAVTSPLSAWVELAADDKRRGDASVPTALYRQGLLWRDMVRGERQSDDLDQPSATDVWNDMSLYKHAALALRGPLTLAGAGALMMILGAALLASGSLGSGLSTAISIVGALGLTSAGLYGRAKANLTSMLASIRQEVQLERVRRAASLCPPKPPAAAVAARPWWKRTLKRIGVRLTGLGQG